MSEWMVLCSVLRVHCMYSINIRGMCTKTQMHCVRISFQFLYIWSRVLSFLFCFRSCVLPPSLWQQHFPLNAHRTQFNDNIMHIINARNESNDFGFRCDFRQGRVRARACVGDAKHTNSVSVCCGCNIIYETRREWKFDEYDRTRRMAGVVLALSPKFRDSHYNFEFFSHVVLCRLV